MGNNKLENLEAVTILMIMSIANIVLISSRILIKTCSTASLLNSLYISILGILLTILFGFLLKKFNGQDLLNISEYLAGRPLKIIIGILFIFYFILRIGIFLKKMSDAMQTIYYPLTNIVFILALFCIACGIIAYLRNNSFIKSMVLLLPILYISIILIFIGNSKNFSFNNMYPILGNGVNSTFFTGFTNIFSFTGLAYFFFLPSKLKNPEKINRIGLYFSILFGIYLIICISNIVLLFTNVLSSSDLPPLYIAVRYIEFGTFFQRLDATFIFLCVLGFILTLNINLYFILDILKELTSVSNTKPLIFPCLLTSLGIALSIRQNSTMEFLEDKFAKTLFIIFAIIIPFIILNLSILKKSMENKKHNKIQITNKSFYKK